MRLRRLELVVLAVTLAFACFMGGFFTGRSWSTINVISVAAENIETHAPEIFTKAPAEPQKEQPQVNTAPQVSEAEAKQPQTEQNTGAPQEPAGAPVSGDGKININLATQSELTDLPGIGSVLASRIVDYRRQHGDYGRIEDIRNVSGIGEKRYEAISDKITVG